MSKFRTEKDSLGPIEVAEDRLWGAQTERSLRNFAIGGQLMPREIIHALALGKKVAAKSQRGTGRRSTRNSRRPSPWRRDEILSGRLDDHFPLKCLADRLGHASHMNVNEVIANRANERLGAARGAKAPVHPNDHVNSASPRTIASRPPCMSPRRWRLKHKLLPALRRLRSGARRQGEAFGLI